MKLRISLLLFVISNLAGCELIDSWSEKEIVTQRLDLTQNVDNIKVNNTFEIVLIQDMDSYVEIICNDNIQSKVDIRLQNKTLFLDNSISNRWLNGYEKVKLVLHIPYIPVIDIYKPCKIETQGTFKSDMFYLVDWGNFTDCNVSIDVNLFCLHSSGDSFGSYNVSGNSLKTILYCRGSASYELKSFLTDSCFLSQESIMDLSINAKEYLDILIKSSGNVFYSGNPSISIVRTGTGNLIKQ